MYSISSFIFMSTLPCSVPFLVSVYLFPLKKIPHLERIFNVDVIINCDIEGLTLARILLKQYIDTIYDNNLR